MQRYNPTIEKGLTTEQVENRIKDGFINIDDQPKTKTIKEIIKSNFFNYFNFLNTVLGIAVFTAGCLNGQILQGLKNCLFMGVIIINSIISIIEEVISKKIIDKLSILNENTVITIRNGKKENLANDELVLDDIIIMSTGHQIVADSIILDGEVEVNESLLTGEPDSIIKKQKDELLSGSFIVSGNCYAKVNHVGADNYVNKISKEAKYNKKNNSVMMLSFEKLLKILSVLIIPIGIIMYISQYDKIGSSTEAIFRTVAALIGMIPEGLVLLTSSVLAVSVIRLSKYKVLVQQLYCIENLARVDTICLDKTGTLTEGKMEVVDYIPLKNYTKEELKDIISAYANASNDNNFTMSALKTYFSDSINWIKKDSIPFSSDRKFSAIAFDKENYYVGAPEFLPIINNNEIENLLNKYQEDFRTILIAKNNGKLIKNPKKLEPVGLVILSDIIRKEAKNTLDYFKSQGVDVKIISGDNISTVINIAKKVGLTDVKGINIDTFTESETKKVANKYNIFGRVSPIQKKWLVESYQNNNHTVAMTGDGVNDVLALKQSDCAISISAGADAAKNVAQLVLLNNNFDSLPVIVSEGRRTVNNIERSGSLLLVKTIYTILLIFLSLLFNTRYFFVPIQLTLITAFTIGTPSFILALERNNEIIRGKFLLKIVSRALPASLTGAFNVILIICCTYIFHLSNDVQNTLCVYLITITGFIYLYKISKPFTIVRKILLFVMISGFSYCILFQYHFFNLNQLTPGMFIIILVLSIVSIYVYRKLNWFITWLFHKKDNSIKIEKDYI